MIRLAGYFAALSCLLSIAASAAAAVPAAHRISVRIDPQTRILEATDAISFDAARTATLVLAARLKVDALAVDGRSIPAVAKVAHGLQRIVLPAAHRIEVRWSGTLAAPDRSLDHRGVLAYGEPTSGADGTYLPAGSGWYPMVDGSLERYSLVLELPAGQRGLVPGRLVEEREAGGRYRARFEFVEPAEGIALLAGPYRVDERRLRTAAGSNVRLRTYFHQEIADLAHGYLDSIAAYLDLYEHWIGAYPYTEFSVVSSPTPTGLGMPTLTYLGTDVLRLPFIRSTSLGHEILHNWWGNGVYPDFARGNWAEGLTTFMADYAYREREGPVAASEMRLAWLRSYAAMPASDDLPLVRFVQRTHGASQVVGYNKAAMVFFMLRDEIGAAAFDEGLRSFWREQRFRIASWSDLRTAFERASGKRLSAFFAQWLERPGAPELRIADAQAAAVDSGWRLNITFTQGTPAAAISVPIVIRSAAGEIARRVELTREREMRTLDLPAEPYAVTLDPEWRLFRKLAVEEAPPILREVMLAESPATITASADAAVQAAARKLAARLLERSSADPGASPAILVMGLHADMDAWLAARGMAPRPAQLAAQRGSAQVWTVRADQVRVYALVSARDPGSLTALESPLPHYGGSSYLVFDGARVIERGNWPATPQVWELRPVAAR